MLTVGLLAVVVYLYTVVAFNFFRKFYNKSEDDDEPDMKCDDMMTVRVQGPPHHAPSLDEKGPGSGVQGPLSKHCKTRIRERVSQPRERNVLRRWHKDTGIHFHAPKPMGRGLPQRQGIQ